VHIPQGVGAAVDEGIESLLTRDIRKSNTFGPTRKFAA
jgi:hypothetical protein